MKECNSTIGVIITIGAEFSDEYAMASISPFLFHTRSSTIGGVLVEYETNGE